MTLKQHYFDRDELGKPTQQCANKLVEEKLRKQEAESLLEVSPNTRVLVTILRQIKNDMYERAYGISFEEIHRRGLKGYFPIYNFVDKDGNFWTLVEWNMEDQIPEFSIKKLDQSRVKLNPNSGGYETKQGERASLAASADPDEMIEIFVTCPSETNYIVAVDVANRQKYDEYIFFNHTLASEKARGEIAARILNAYEGSIILSGSAPLKQS